MDPIYAIPLLAVLIVALYTVNRVAKRNRLRRRLLNSAMGRDNRPLRFKDKDSPRSEMRAYNDPSTVAGNIRTTTSAPAFRQKRHADKHRR